MINRVVNGAGYMSDSECPDTSAEIVQWRKQGYINPEIKFLNLYPLDTPVKFTHGLELDVVMVRGEEWNPEIIKERYQKVANIYGKQCGIKFTSARVILVDPPTRSTPPPPGVIQKFDPGLRKKNSTGSFAENIPTGTKRATIIHVPKLEYGLVAASGSEKTKGGTNGLHKLWVGSDVVQPTYTDRHADYCSEAHELGHVLMNCEHHYNGKPATEPDCPGDREPTLMNFASRRANGELTPAQCEIMKNYKPLVRKL